MPSTQYVPQARRTLTSNYGLKPLIKRSHRTISAQQTSAPVIDELSGASVPFRFDIHTLFFSEDAVTLENELHKHFAARALNRANPRKEFFFATPAEVRDVLVEKVGNLLEFSDYAQATEYLQSINLWPARPSLGPVEEAQPHDM